MALAGSNGANADDANNGVVGTTISDGASLTAPRTPFSNPLWVARYSENDFLLEEQELNDLRVSLEDAEHLFEVTISKKLHVCELLCKMEGSCSVCLEKYKEGEELGILHCSHEFHADCIKIWLLCKNVCPLCKAIGIPI
ncbi:E3 ubiquitin protein ligase MBR2-like protein isoform X1 [Tanacetum coccineum]